MSDLDRLLRQADRVVSPDLWPDIHRRQPTEPPGHRLVAGVVALAVAASGIALAATAFFGEMDRRPVTPTEPVDPTATARIDVGGRPSSIAAGEGAVWVGVQAEEVSSGEDGVVRIDPATNEIVARIPLKQPPTQLVAGFGAVWAAGFEGDKGSVIYRIDPANNRVVDEIRDASQPMAIGHGVLWASRHDPDTERSALLRIDPATNRVESLLPLPLSYPSFDIDVGPGAVWVLAQGRIDLVEVDPETVAVRTSRDLDLIGIHMALHDGLLWMARLEGDHEVVSRFDPHTASFREPIQVAGFLPFDADSEGVWFLGEGRPPVRGVCRLNGTSLAVDACVDPGLRAEALDAAALDEATGTVWFAHYRRWVSRIDLVPSATPSVEIDLGPRVTAEIQVGQYPLAVAAGEGAVWVTVNNADPPEEWYLARIDPSTNEVTDHLEIDEAADVAVGAGSVWVAATQASQGAVLFRIDPATLDIIATIPLNCERCVAGEIVATFEAVWTAAGSTVPYPAGWLFLIDPRITKVTERIQLERPAEDLAAVGETLWMHAETHFRDGMAVGATLYRLASAESEPFLTGQVTPHGGGTRPPVLAVGDRYVWTSRIDGQVIRLDRRTDEVEELGIAAPFNPFGAGEGGVWFRGGVEDAHPTIARLNTSNLRVDRSVSLDAPIIDAALDPVTGTIWLATYEGPVIRIDLR
jgi:DNA-binding beta-propeller fold protein YncE